MINFLERILIESNYEVVKKSENSIFLNNSSINKHDYYYIFDLGKFTTVDLLKQGVEKSQELFMNREIKFNDSSKNTSALYLINLEDRVFSDEIKFLIYELEESPYNMKQNVLYYSTKEFDCLTALSTQENLKDAILLGVKNQELFKKHKSSLEGSELYSIISKIFIKLNCLKYSFESNTKFLSLDDEISSQAKYSEEIDIDHYGVIDENLSKVADNTLEVNDFYSLLSKKIESELDDNIDSEVTKCIDKMLKKIK